MSSPPGTAPTKLDPYFRAKYQEKLTGVREAIREVERIIYPLRRLVEETDARLARLRADEAAYLDALKPDTSDKTEQAKGIIPEPSHQEANDGS